MKVNTNISVVGAGVISAIGNTWAENFISLQNGLSGISGMLVLDSLHNNNIPVGEVKLTNQELVYRTGTSRRLSRSSLLAIHAAKEAYLDSGIRNMKFWRVGIVSGTTCAGMDRSEKFMNEYLPDPRKGRLRDIAGFEPGRVTEQVADALEIHDHVSTISTGCSSGANAILQAARLIQHNIVDVVFAGGTESLSRYLLNGYVANELVDTKPCRPWSTSRKGLSPGEGAGYLVMVSDRVVEEENLIPFAQLTGYGNCHEAFHQKKSSLEGKGPYSSMNQALGMASLQPSDIDYINLHATGLVYQDLSEAVAIDKLFAGTMPLMSSTKGFTGNTFGAGGGIESVYSVMSLRHQCIYPSVGFDRPMPEPGLIPVTGFTKVQVKSVMTNAFSMDGNCASLIFKSQGTQTPVVS